MAVIENLQATRYMDTGRDSRQSRRLIVINDGQMQEYNLLSLKKDRIFFGRDDTTCDIVISNQIVSRVHGKIKLQDGNVLVGDLGSTNGIFCFQGQQYERMLPKRYYSNHTSDLILRIEGTVQGVKKSVVLIFTSSDNKNAWQRIPIGNEMITIGRDSRNTIVMDTPSFSRKHAALCREENGYRLYDNRSMNGVYVNGERIQNSVLIQETDLIHIAGMLFFVLNGSLMYQGTGSGVSLHLENITKTVGNGANRKKILNHVYCDIGSNEFVAIIGGSGAGKTTVMNAMSGFDSQIQGKVFCNGIDLRKNFSSMKNMIGFVPQQDIIYENLKLHKMLYYTARMKMPSDTSREEMEKRIHKVLQMVDLQEHADTYIRKLSGGQKKRASIAVELLADPGLFFLDEPTSGLDPDTEQSLMHTLAKLSKSEGKTIIMVTHTTQSIHLCDKVIFMGPGGKICFCGAPSEINNYFGKENLVEVYNELAGNVDRWNQCYLQNYMQENGEVSAASSEEGKNIAVKQSGESSRQVSSLRQLCVLTARYFELIWNDKQRLLLLLLQPLIIALLLTVVAQSDAFRIYEPTQSIMFALACSGIWIGLFNTIQEVCKERPILKREYMGNLKLWAYIVSKYIVQGVICIVQSTVLTTLFLLLMKHGPKKEQILPTPQLEIWLTIFLTIFASAAMGLIVSALVRNADRAMAIAPFVLIIQLLFSGVLFELKGAAHKISNFTVSRWAMECLGNITNLNKLDSKIKEIPREANDFYNRGAGHLSQTWGILLLVSLVCGVISIIVLHNLKKDQR